MPRTALTTMGADSVGSPVCGMNFVGGVFSFEEDDAGDEADWWQYEDGRYPLTRLECAVGFDRSEVTVHMDGGDAVVRIDSPNPGEVTLIGPAEHIATVSVEI